MRLSGNTSFSEIVGNADLSIDIFLIYLKKKILYIYKQQSSMTFSIMDKPCKRSNQQRHPSTHRCRKVSKCKGKYQTRDPVTFRCKSDIMKKPCSKKGYSRNEITHRCKKDKPPCKKSNQFRNPATGRCKKRSKSRSLSKLKSRSKSRSHSRSRSHSFSTIPLLVSRIETLLGKKKYHDTYDGQNFYSEDFYDDLEDLIHEGLSLNQHDLKYLLDTVQKIMVKNHFVDKGVITYLMDNIDMD